MASICPSLRGGFVPEFKRDLVIFTLDGWCPFVPQGFFAAAMNLVQPCVYAIAFDPDQWRAEEIKWLSMMSIFS